MPQKLHFPLESTRHAWFVTVMSGGTPSTVPLMRKPKIAMIDGPDDPAPHDHNRPQATGHKRLETRKHMRSSKSRSRSKNNRSRSVGNIVNRVFDSSGPEGKVRGTPQQIIDKYNQLARDAQLGNDRVAAENFQQHAEHYARMLGEAQREQEARREQQERERQQQREQQEKQQQDKAPRDQKGGGDRSPDAKPAAKADEPAGDVIDVADSESGLVETPEEKPAPKRRAPRKPKAKPQDAPAKDEAPAGDAARATDPERAAE